MLRTPGQYALGPHVVVWIHADSDGRITTAEVEEEGVPCGLTLEANPEVSRALFRLKNGRVSRYPAPGYESLDDFVDASLAILEHDARTRALQAAQLDMAAEHFDDALQAFEDLLAEESDPLLQFARLLCLIQLEGLEKHKENLLSVLVPALCSAGLDGEQKVLTPCLEQISAKEICDALQAVEDWPDEAAHDIAQNWQQRVIAGEISDLVWERSAGLPHFRKEPTLLETPEGLLFVGGIEGSLASGTQEICDDTDLLHPDGRWERLDPLRCARLWPALAALPNGDVLAIGGEGHMDPRSVERLRAKDGAWKKAPPLTYGRNTPGAVSLDDGRILVVGGLQGRMAICPSEIFDPEENAWILGPSLYSDIEQPVLLKLGDGSVLIVGDAWALEGIDRPVALLDAELKQFTSPPELLEALGHRSLPDGIWAAAHCFSGGRATKEGAVLWTLCDAFDSEGSRLHGAVLVAGCWYQKEARFEWCPTGIRIVESPGDAQVIVHASGEIIVFLPDQVKYSARSLDPKTGRQTALCAPPGSRPKSFFALRDGRTLAVDRQASILPPLSSSLAATREVLTCPTT